VATTDVHGCTANGKVEVVVIPTYDIFIPNAFTPNGDGNNDFFQVFGNKEAWKYFEVSVFDRWGEKVYESNDMNFMWNGEFKGKASAMGVYVYEIHLVYLDDHTDKLFKGTVTLVR
jgi:gliding motility-associated-like protein